MRSSQRAFDKIIGYEVSSQARYVKKFQRPEWPGESSGATVGIGYDLGQTPAATIRADWQGRVPDAMLAAMVSASGQTGAAGKVAAAHIRSQVSIPWETALAVHKECVVPRWEARVIKALPNAEKLPADCFGALLSLSFNRGTSYNLPQDRYREMRQIRAAMIAEHYEAIPGYIRAMKRLWPNLRGLLDRRDDEAALFAAGLKTWNREAPLEDDAEVGRPPPADPISSDDDGGEIAPASPPVFTDAEFDPALQDAQKKLKAMNYSPGGEDGKWGGMTAGAFAGFINDRQIGISAPTSTETFEAMRLTLLAALVKAEAEGFTRPVAEARANADPATVAKVAPEVVPVKQNFLVEAWGAVVAFFAAIYNAVSEHIAAAWHFFTDHKDSVPTDSGTLKMAWGYIASIPSTVWIVLAGVGLALIAFNARRAVSKIAESVKTGARQ